MLFMPHPNKMKSLQIFLLFVMVHFAFAGSDHYDDERDDDNKVIIKAISVPGKFPAHIQATHALFVDKQYFYTSGIYGIDTYGHFEKGLKAQIERIFKIILSLLARAHLKLKNVVVVTVIVDIEYFKQFFEIYEDYFPKKEFPTIFIFEGKLPKGAWLQISVKAIYGKIRWVEEELEDY